MRAVAGWLTARPWNAILGLAMTLVLPFAQILSGAVVVLLVLAHGLRMATLEAFAAVALLGGLFLAFGNPAVPMVVSALVAWLPVTLLAVVMRQARSMALALQLSVIIAVLATIGFYIAVDDSVAFWTGKLEQIATMLGNMGLEQQGTVISEEKELIAPQMTMMFVATSWSLTVLTTVLGYALLQQLPGRAGVYGRFSDLQFGRVIAVSMALASLLAVAVGASWLQNLAFVLFAVFWLQGLAIVHWLHTDGPLPMVLVVAVYALLPILNALLVMGLAVVGYTDAWFNYRPRIRAARGGS